jgi:hypothetical protein
MKYDTVLAEWLVIEFEPDATVGSSSSGNGWAGRYDDLGVILIEDTDGVVSTIVCSEENFSMKWADTEHEFGPSESPEEEDYVISPNLFVVPLMMDHDTLEEAMSNISDDMAARNFYPNVWLQDDHGGFTNVSEDLPDRS